MYCKDTWKTIYLVLVTFIKKLIFCNDNNIISTFQNMKVSFYPRTGSCLLPPANVCEGYVRVRVCHFWEQRGLPECILGYHLPGPGTPSTMHRRDQTLPRADTPWTRHPPGPVTPLGAGTPKDQAPPEADTPQPPTPHPQPPKHCNAGRYSQQAGSVTIFIGVIAILLFTFFCMLGNVNFIWITYSCLMNMWDILFIEEIIITTSENNIMYSLS